jgi:polyisoprenoid-binding protein YceI
MKSILVGLALAVAIPVAPNMWGVRQAEVRVICPMTIGGSFDAKTKALSGSLTVRSDGPPAFDGSLVVDLRTLDTGISLRNEHLRQRYLEVDKQEGFGAATLTKIDLAGLNPNTPEGRGTFTGSLTLHGVTNAVTGSVEAHDADAGLRVRASFPVTLSDYSIPPPRYLGVGVKDVVRVEVDFTVTH